MDFNQKTSRISAPLPFTPALPSAGPVPYARPVAPEVGSNGSVSAPFAPSANPSMQMVRPVAPELPTANRNLMPSNASIAAAAAKLYQPTDSKMSAFAQGFTNARALMDKAERDAQLAAEEKADKKLKLDREYARQDLADRRADEKHVIDLQRGELGMERDRLGMRKTQAEIDKLLNKDADELKPNEMAALANARADEIKSVKAEFGDYPGEEDQAEIASRIRTINQRYNHKLGYDFSADKPGARAAAPSSPASEKLITATGPNGEKVVLRDGRWEKM